MLTNTTKSNKQLYTYTNNSHICVRTHTHTVNSPSGHVFFFQCTHAEPSCECRGNEERDEEIMS